MWLDVGSEVLLLGSLSCSEAVPSPGHERDGVQQSHPVSEDQSGKRLCPESTDQGAGQERLCVDVLSGFCLGLPWNHVYLQSCGVVVL